MSKFSPGSISLVDYEPKDELLWSRWQNEVDFKKYQARTRPKGFQKDLGTIPGQYTLKLITFNGQKIGAIWLEILAGGPQATAELGHFIGEKSLWNKGLGTIAVQQMLAVAKDLGIKRIQLNVRETNVSAIICYKKCGFTVKEKYPPRRFEDGSYQGWYLMERCIS